MVGNIVGEPFKKYVNNQIKVRQQVYGDGFDSSRNQNYINYLNSRLSWVKMASSVLVNPPRSGDRVNINQAIPTGTSNNEGLNRLSKLGFINPEAFLGYKLASSAILFNGLQQATFDDKVNSDDGSIDPTIADKFNKWATRFGYSKTNSIWNQSAYGLGGTDFGLQPMPGITGVEVNHINRGSIKKATITLKAYNKFQFELIDLLYLRLGFTMLIEWGNSHYIESDNSNIRNIETVGATLTEQFWFQSNGNTPLEISKKIEEYRKKYDSNYDAMVGRVSNFNWSFNPDGSYDIQIQLTSYGDVVESFKVNTLPNPSNDDKSDELEDKENISQLSLHLYRKRKNLQEFQYTDKNYISFYNGNLWDNFKKIFGGDIEEKYSYYIKFGKLLDYIKNHILYEFKNNDKKYPIVDINYETDKNVMAIFPNQISFDPRVCIVKTTYFDPPLNPNIEIPFYSQMESFSSNKGGIDYGKLMNIYLNFNFIEEILERNLDSKGNLSLYSFLKSICDGINKSLGSVNNLEPIVNEETNTLLIIDQTQFQGRDELRESLSTNGSITNLDENETEENLSFPINVYGYNTTPSGSSSNFVKSYSFNTEIGPDLANTIAIGATATGTVVGEDATAFSQWNEGLTDKFQQSFSSPFPPLDLSVTVKEKQDPTTNAVLTSEGYVRTDIKETLEEVQRIKEEELVKRYRDNYLPLILGKALNTKNTPSNFVEVEPKYLKFDKDTINRGFSSWKNYFSSINGLLSQNQNKKYTTGTLGFIPINLQIELDGISGIKIYQKLRVDTKFLPSNYPDVLEFLVKQVNHSIKENKWITTLETISLPVIQKVPLTNQTEVTELSTILPPEDLVFYSPINDDLSPSNLPNVIRNDNAGEGTYGAKRENNKLHNGIDLLSRGAYGGTLNYNTFFSPIPGNIYITKAKTLSKTSGVRIEGTGKYTGYTAYIFYIKPSIQSGQSIKLGDPIGSYQSVSLDYTNEVKDHIHFQIKVEKEGKTYYLDPTTLNYTFNVTLGSKFEIPNIQFLKNIN